MMVNSTGEKLQVRFFIKKGGLEITLLLMYYKKRFKTNQHQRRHKELLLHNTANRLSTVSCNGICHSIGVIDRFAGVYIPNSETAV